MKFIIFFFITIELKRNCDIINKGDMMKKTNDYLKNENNEMKNLLIIIGIITIVAILFYCITIFVTREEEVETVVDVSIQYDEILAGNIFSQSDESYYVIVYNDGDVNNDLYYSYMSLYQSSTESLNFYTVNIDDIFNQKFIGEDNNITTNIENLKFAVPTMLKIENGEISVFKEDKEEIVNYLIELVDSTISE